VLLHLKAIRMLVCLKMLVTFLICGDEYVKVAHFVPFLKVVGVGDFGCDMLHCILSCNQVSTDGGMLLQCAVCVAIPHIVVLCQVGT
jgi:hypothetical protein